MFVAATRKTQANCYYRCRKNCYSCTRNLKQWPNLVISNISHFPNSQYAVL